MSFQALLRGNNGVAQAAPRLAHTTSLPGARCPQQCKPFGPALLQRPARSAAPPLQQTRAVATETESVASPLRTAFYGLTDEAKLWETLEAEAGSGRVPKQLVAAFKQLYGNYKAAVTGSGVPGHDDELVATVMASIVDRVLVEFISPYTFPSHHHRILEPYNYYEFGQRYVSALIDYSRSVVGNVDRFAQIEAQLAAGENVVMLANHQTEADPGVWALLLEAVQPRLATEVTYVAGDRVVTDALCKPFSMGRNLFCVHSKKHLDDFPELKAEKQATNRRTLKAMSTKLNEGGQLLWIAPSGGRDRKNMETGELLPDEFDPTAVELMRQLLDRAKPAGHIYPFAMHSYNVMPPPETKEKAVGEARYTNFSPCGISVGPEMDVGAVLEGVPQDDKEARIKALSDAAYTAVVAEYKAMMRAIESKDAWGTAYSQPWADQKDKAEVASQVPMPTTEAKVDKVEAASQVPEPTTEAKTGFRANVADFFRSLTGVSLTEVRGRWLK